MAAVAAQEFDACYVEGFDNKQFDEILNLKSQGLLSTMRLTIAHRSKKDKTSAMAKVRKPIDVLIENNLLCNCA